MAKSFPTDAELDALIAAALSEEVLLPVPVDLRVKIDERVHLAALQQREQARFRNAMLTGFAGSVGMLAALGVVIALTKFDVLLKHGISGGRGLLDSYAATFALTWQPQMGGFVFSLLLGLGIVVAWVGLAPLFWREGVATHHVQTGKSAAQGPFQVP